MPTPYPTQHFATSGPVRLEVMVPVGEKSLGRLFNVIGEAIDGKPNSIVAEIRDSVVSDDGWSGITGGFSPANAVPANVTVPSRTT